MIRYRLAALVAVVAFARSECAQMVVDGRAVDVLAAGIFRDSRKPGAALHGGALSLLDDFGGRGYPQITQIL